METFKKFVLPLRIPRKARTMPAFVRRKVGSAFQIRLRRNRQNDIRMPVQSEEPEVNG